MKTKVENGDKTYWVGMTLAQVKSLRFLCAVVLTWKETGTDFATMIERTNDADGGHGLMWESTEALEASLKEQLKLEQAT